MGKQQRSEETRERILRSAGRLFARVSFASARIADVIEPLGLTQGAFYFHFENKRDLALEVIRREHRLKAAARCRLSHEAQVHEGTRAESRANDLEYAKHT